MGTVTSLQVGQWQFAVGAACADVAMASTAEAPFLEVEWDDGAQALARVGTPVFVVQGIGFGLDNMVNSVSPRGSRVTA